MRRTPTNTGPDGKAKVRFFFIEVEGSQFIAVAVAAMIGLLLFMMSGSDTFFLKRIAIAFIPLGAMAAYFIFFVYGKPPGYGSDRFNTLLEGKVFLRHSDKWSGNKPPYNPGD